MSSSRWCGSYHLLGTEDRDHIVYILKLSTKDLDTLTANKELVLDAMLLESPYVTYLFFVKSIIYSCCLAFSHALKRCYL